MNNAKQIKGLRARFEIILLSSNELKEIIAKVHHENKQENKHKNWAIFVENETKNVLELNSMLNLLNLNIFCS